MTSDDLKKLFQEAAEIAKAVPKELREAAFNRALDALSVPGAKESPTPARQPRRERGTDGETPQDAATLLLSDLDRARHPEVASARRVLERALFVLRAARDDHSLDGLSSPQIATVLTEKFRLRTTRQAVTQALDAAGDKVDRNASGRVAIYRLMHPGDEYLTAGEFPTSQGSARGGPGRKKKATKSGSKESATKKKRTKSKTSAKKTASSKKATSRSRRPGPGAMLRTLVQSGFFSKPRTIGDIQDHAQHNLAHSYGLNELSTPLRRAIHSNLLVRTQNSDGQYEYSAL